MLIWVSRSLWISSMVACGVGVQLALAYGVVAVDDDGVEAGEGFAVVVGGEFGEGFVKEVGAFGQGAGFVG